MTATVLVMPTKTHPGSEFGERLTTLRKARGLTQIDLANAIGSTQRAISHYETKAEYPPAPVVAQLAVALGVTTDELMGIKAHRTKQVDPIDPEAQRLWRKFQQILKLPEKDQRAVIRLINSLVGARAD